MKRLSVTGCCVWALLFAGVAVEQALAGEIELNGHTFVLPDGFVIELVANAPLVERPITAAFDERGRLYVADSSGSNDKPDKQLVERPHRILRLEDTDGDGTLDKQTVFADHMMFPEGTMWLDGSVYVAAPPSIWKLTDTNDDGVADERIEWFQGKTLTGCANDLHGPYPGLDGWIYWCKGAFAEQTYERPGKKPFVTKASHIFRCRPDGSGIEPVMTGGMDNPVDVVFTPGGERIFTTTFLQHPGGGKRDGLIHAIYGGVYGKIHDPIEHHPRTGDVLPTLVHMGPAAPCGLVRFESNAFGDDHRDNLFACQFNMHKVSRHALKPAGATFQSTDSDFVVSKNLDFHPTDILEDADGSLVIVDTGGWYKLCCPTSQLWKPDILGAIYRVRRKGMSRIDDPRGLKLDWAKLDARKLSQLLDDNRPAVRSRAMSALAKRGSESIPILAEMLKADSARARLNAVWTLTRIDHADARSAIRAALTDADETVRQAAAHSTGLWRDKAAFSALAALLENNSPHNQRAAAEALGRIGDASARQPLLLAAARLGKTGSETKSSEPAAAPIVGAPAEPEALNYDRILEHSLMYALIEIGDFKNLSPVILYKGNPWVARVALVASDQMEGSALEPEVVADLLSDESSVLKEGAAWVVSRHPEWGDVLAGYLRGRVAAKDLKPADLAELERQLAQFAGSKAVQKLVAESLVDASLNSNVMQALLRAIRAAGMKELPAGWRQPLAQLLDANDPNLLHEAVQTLRALPVPKEGVPEWKTALLAVAANKTVPSDVRLEALAAVPGGLDTVDNETFAFLSAGLSPDNPALVRAAAADVLAKAKLTSGQLVALTKLFAHVGPLEADKLLGAYENSADEPVGLALLAALKESPVLTSLRVDSIRQRLAKQSQSVQSKGEELYGLINLDLAEQRKRLEEILPTLAKGDIRRGQEVFRREKSACITCHSFGYVGGKVGPDLTRIGGIRNERDLLEAIMFPSASFVRSYEPVAVVTTQGKLFNGLVKNDAPDEVLLQLNATETARIARNDIEEIRPSSVSVMPAGLDKQLTPQELADLIAFLKNAK